MLWEATGGNQMEHCMTYRCQGVGHAGSRWREDVSSRDQQPSMGTNQNAVRLIWAYQANEDGIPRFCK